MTPAKLARYRAFWDRAFVERPLVGFTLAGWFPLQEFAACRPAKRGVSTGMMHLPSGSVPRVAGLGSIWTSPTPWSASRAGVSLHFQKVQRAQRPLLHQRIVYRGRTEAGDGQPRFKRSLFEHHAGQYGRGRRPAASCRYVREVSLTGRFTMRHSWLDRLAFGDDAGRQPSSTSV